VKKAGVYFVSFSAAAVEGTFLNLYFRLRLYLVSSNLVTIYLLQVGEDMATQNIILDTEVG
jgi:hypothetical protein